MSGSAGRIRLVLAVLAVLVLVGVVAVASTGSTPAGTSDARAPADILLDTFFSFALLALIPAAALLVYGLMQRKAIAEEIASGRYPRTGLAAVAAFALVVTAAVYFGLRGRSIPFLGGIGAEGFPGNPRTGVPTGEGVAENTYEPHFAWFPVVVVLALAATGIAAYVIASRRRRQGLNTLEEGVAEHVADVLEDTLDDLRAESDPRRAVIAAYARLERALAASGLPRWEAETAEEYVARILDRLDVERDPVRRLTDLFAWAKFSQHEVDGTMKDAAIAALVQIRDELRAAARRRQEEREQALTAREQTEPS